MKDTERLIALKKKRPEVFKRILLESLKDLTIFQGGLAILLIAYIVISILTLKIKDAFFATCFLGWLAIGIQRIMIGRLEEIDGSKDRSL